MKGVGKNWAIYSEVTKISASIIRAQFRAIRKRGEFLVGAAVGSGLFASAAAQGGADFLLALNAGRFRLMGTASVACMLPIADANSFVASFGCREFVERCSVPVIFGASAMVPDRSAEQIAAWVGEMGFAGLTNYPTVINYPDQVAAAMGAAQVGFDKELAMLAAGQKLGLFAIAYVKTAAQARAAAALGIDMICLIYGWTTERTAVKSAVTPQAACMLARGVAKVVRQENPESFLVLEGGPLGSAEDLMPIYRAARIDGYIGGSTIDRFPLQEAVTNQLIRFKGTAAATRQHTEKERALLTFGRSLGFAGSSQRILRFLKSLREFSRSVPELPLLISGERGSGRQSAAEALFRLRGIEADRLTIVDAGEMPPQRLMTVLFGHIDAEKGRSAMQGLFGRSDIKGVIVRGLERVTAYTQRRIARAMALGKFRPMGGKRERSGVLPVIFIAGAPIAAMRTDQLLDPELAELLDARELEVPAVREYTEDIEELLLETIGVLAQGTPPRYRFSPAALHRLQTHRWPGNRHELRAFATRLMAAGGGEEVDEAMLTALLEADPNQGSRPTSERDVILDALWRHGFHRTRTAGFLGIARKTLYNKIQYYKLMG